ncbi:probable E3 ubiquitin-protein ligase RHB1A isoform X1 [Arachis stenosperma]|uniref:probable E3 ubiquitin-protein ligase RHB1A isoform X1 n=1 Tax=Arachis stenosperma TaxID=217475 RepID=UPI0025AB8561|nr:probable E3 ubiquitin-protein ligase RHB1A isoform X1 [Arachis stenosperma]XP_057756872.1 probable E3 ubiquitin-protein ligase RHB1A isoform X1 [Arachis stenosperma]XP_057756873.1 probable E3 ubiquitin-protein ligase RHB1A isoform X1 [Arachis stenosperma]
MGGCCCSARKPHLHGTPVYYYCPPTLEERELLTSNDASAATLTAGLLIGLNLDASTPDTFQPPPAPLPYDVVFGGSASTDSESGRETVSGSSFETLIAREDLEEAESKVKAQENSEPISPKKAELLKSNQTQVLLTEEEDVCPICLEEYDVENPKNLTKCEHHFHLSCILEWMERSDSCPICDQVLETKRVYFCHQSVMIWCEMIIVFHVTGNDILMRRTWRLIVSILKIKTC